MENDVVVVPIPLEVAVRLCEEIRKEFEQDHWYTSAARWCWSCQQSSGGDPANRGFLMKPGNRGCILINARYQGQEYPV